MVKKIKIYSKTQYNYFNIIIIDEGVSKEEILTRNELKMFIKNNHEYQIEFIDGANIFSKINNLIGNIICSD
jgi:hypothetical protein